MSWPVRSKRLGLYNNTIAANTVTVLGTVPAGKVWLVKEWSVVNFGGAARNVWLVLRVGAVDTYVDGALAVPAGGVTGQNTRHLVLNAGESICLATSTVSLIHFQVSGAQLG